MTRCECAGIAFEEAVRRMRSEGLALEQAVRRSGCGLTCGACIPDLVRHLHAAAMAHAAGEAAKTTVR